LGIALEVHADISDSSPPRIRADEHKIAQVIRNLVSNGLKFTPPGGRVDVHTSYIDTDDDTGIRCLKVFVTDNGAGISQVRCRLRLYVSAILTVYVARRTR
jgi:signal transduction histidine kinase